MAKTPSKTSVKHMQISKANTVISITLAVAAFLTIFALVATKSLLEQRAYNSKVIDKKETALRTLKANETAVETLETSYREFVSQEVNIIGGERDGEGDRDGDNAKIVLDALPSKYDFPAVATSVEKILESKSLMISEIQGTDDEIAQAEFESESPEVVEIPFGFSVSGSYDSLHDLIKTLEQSIRPINIRSMTIAAGGENGVSLDVEALTYYQSAKTFNVTKEVVKP